MFSPSAIMCREHRGVISVSRGVAEGGEKVVVGGWWWLGGVVEGVRHA